MYQENGCEVVKSHCIFLSPLSYSECHVLSVKLQTTYMLRQSENSYNATFPERKMTHVLNNCSAFGNQSYRYYIHFPVRRPSTGK